MWDWVKNCRTRPLHVGPMCLADDPRMVVAWSRHSQADAFARGDTLEMPLRQICKKAKNSIATATHNRAGAPTSGVPSGRLGTNFCPTGRQICKKVKNSIATSIHNRAGGPTDGVGGPPGGFGWGVPQGFRGVFRGCSRVFRTYCRVFRRFAMVKNGLTPEFFAFNNALPPARAPANETNFT